MTLPQLTPNQIEQIARIVGDTSAGFTGSELGHLLAQCRMDDPDSGLTKWKRLYNAFCVAVNESGSTNIVFQFIQYCMEPAQGLNDSDRYGWMRFELNQVLMLVGIEIRDDGQFYSVSKAQSLGEVQRRTKALREKLTGYGVHSAVLRCCRDELLAQDYFHAVQEAAKSLCDRVRTMSGLTTDGVRLFNTAFAVGDPYGLKEMLCGVIHMVRNVTAHELRIHWDVNEKDAVDILTQISYLHKLLDVCVTVPRTTLRK